jgi:hypothetical protein
MSAGKSVSLRGVVPFAPLFRRDKSASKSAGDSAMPAGQPSTTKPTAFPCDSPKMLILNILPNEFMDLGF